MLNWLRNIFVNRKEKNGINREKPELTSLERELQEIDRILKMTDPEEKKKYYPKMKELLSKISSHYENQIGGDFDQKGIEDFSKYIELMRELAKDLDTTS